ncbi:GNAT family N-acetyltransferase [Rhizobium giardinii]|jgi:predicted GNAT family acetyltransferase|uniref:Putative GNAT family acetyltransferase n=1 Tax=Rhizobium giardinii TaxID=56731 RepID=A0A7W8UEF4_9HYPH|nr:GNAT family N-acetyltransferase [Rhizobium giardinii]MBB5537279.1 putative GNAT family acetyltransferase [Rhizobium giardinii]
MSHILDRPIWSALATRHAALAEGSPLARRYQPSVSAFAAARDDRPESLEALGRLAARDEILLLAEANEIVLPRGLQILSTADLVQMTAEQHLPLVSDPRIEQLGEADAAEMLALATLTKPGPFSIRAQAFGNFWGVKIDGRLVAMAGERMKQPGYTELSGVCTHPDVRGKGLARLLSRFVAGQIFAKGDQPYLHAYVTNTAAIALYETIGFKIRSPINVAVVAPAA